MIVVRGADWHTLVSGMSLEKIAVGTNKDGRLEVFAIEKKTNKIYHIWQNEPNTENWNSGWTYLVMNCRLKKLPLVLTKMAVLRSLPLTRMIPIKYTTYGRMNLILRTGIVAGL